MKMRYNLAPVVIHSGNHVKSYYIGPFPWSLAFIPELL